jgi:hypothetical protein
MVKLLVDLMDVSLAERKVNYKVVMKVLQLVDL